MLAEVEHQPVGRLDGRDARRRDRVRVRTPVEPESTARPGGEEPRDQDDQGLRHFRQTRVSLFFYSFIFLYNLLIFIKGTLFRTKNYQRSCQKY